MPSGGQSDTNRPGPAKTAGGARCPLLSLRPHQDALPVNLLPPLHSAAMLTGGFCGVPNLAGPEAQKGSFSTKWDNRRDNTAEGQRSDFRESLLPN